MHEILNSCKEKPNPNFNKNSLILKTPKFCKNPKNLGYKVWNAWKWGIRDLPREEKLDESGRNLEEEV